MTHIDGHDVTTGDNTSTTRRPRHSGDSDKKKERGHSGDWTEHEMLLLLSLLLSFLFHLLQAPSQTTSLCDHLPKQFDKRRTLGARYLVHAKRTLLLASLFLENFTTGSVHWRHVNIIYLFLIFLNFPFFTHSFSFLSPIDNTTTPTI